MRRDTQGICSKSGEGGPLCVHVRPWMPEQHRHTPSLTRGGDAEERQRRKKAERYRGKERQREAENDWAREGRRKGVGGSLMSHLH